jgi:hypothetical protein
MKARTVHGLLAATIWLFSVRFFLTTDTELRGIALTNAQERALFRGDVAAERASMQRINPEWDFMGRTFAALAIVNQAMRDSRRAGAHRQALDEILHSTLAEEERQGDDHFLLEYGHHGAFRDPRAHSLFIDGELALMLAAREVAFGGPATDADAADLARRVERIALQMEAGPALSGESYPDECWTFCNTTALAALRVYDARHGTDHGSLIRRWVQLARQRLVDPDTGMLVSSYGYDGSHRDGPEGSTLWMVAHNLLVLDPSFAREQYALAKQHLARSFAGFGWAREWPGGSHAADVDSGPVIPLLDASAGSSGLAIVGARAFDDREYLDALARSLDFAGMPVLERGPTLRFATSNQVADAVIAYGFSEGPLWRAVGAPQGGAS